MNMQDRCGLLMRRASEVVRVYVRQYGDSAAAVDPAAWCVGLSLRPCLACLDSLHAVCWSAAMPDTLATHAGRVITMYMYNTDCPAWPVRVTCGYQCGVLR